MSAATTFSSFVLLPTTSCDLIELAHLEDEAERFRARLVELELAFFQRVVQSTFAEHPGLESVTIELDPEGVPLVFLDGDIDPPVYPALCARLKSALGREVIEKAIGTWTTYGGYKDTLGRTGSGKLRKTLHAKQDLRLGQSA